jgi:bacteriorhodopsin
MNWILSAYLLGLIFLATRTENASPRGALRAAWIAFALIPFWMCIMYLCRAGNMRNVGILQFIEIVEHAGSALLLGISFIYLSGALAPRK